MSTKIAILRSIKPFENRVAIHPEHLKQIDILIRRLLYIEENYYPNYPDSYYLDLGCNIEPRGTLINSADCCFIVRPIVEDLLQLKPFAASVGWFHCIQQQDIAKVAVEKSQTLICMESLYNNNAYFFTENSKITGRCGVQHALEVSKIKYTQETIVAVIGYGNVAIGAIQELHKLGITNITCYSKRALNEISNKLPNVKFKQVTKPDNFGTVHLLDNTNVINKEFRIADIIINASGQDIHNPAIYLKKNDLGYLKKGSLIIDISCDKEMGFDFATITTFANPIVKMANGILYYAIDHLPTLDYDNASRAISTQLLHILPTLVQYFTIQNCHLDIIENAIQIKQGHIMHSDIKL